MLNIGFFLLFFVGAIGLYFLFVMIAKPSWAVKRFADNGVDIASSKFKWMTVGCLAFSAIGLFFWLFTNTTNPANLKTPEAATKYIQGTWTYTQPIRKENFRGWQKITFRADGTAEAYEAMPTEDNWGKPVIIKYTVEQEKYRDTGEKYWAVVGEYGNILYVVRSNGNLRYDLMDGPNIVDQFELVRKDVNPFK